ncbi:MAG: AraC family transcriptional regulator [Coprobacillus sp.]
MIDNKQHLIELLPTLYDSLNLPIFLLDENKNIINSTPQFFRFKTDYFVDILNNDNFLTYKVYSHFTYRSIYTFFACSLEDIHYVCIGPYLTNEFTKKDSPSSLEFTKFITSQYTINDFINLPVVSANIGKNISLIYQLVTNQTITREELKMHYTMPITTEPFVQDSIDDQLFQLRENHLSEFSYAQEQKMIKAIKEGKSVDARLLIYEFINSRSVHKLSDTPMTSTKYYLVAAITIFTRTVIDAGVPVSKAYFTSDIYINKIDGCSSHQKLYDILNDAIVDFTRLVKRYRDLQNPLWVKTCKDYISKNLHQKITLDDLSQVVSMSPQYLSVQFKKITGISIKEYINKHKIQEAQFLLKNSAYSLSEISIILNYATPSHLSKTFKEVTGKTPLEYKNSK